MAMRSCRADAASWSSMCGLAGSPELPPGDHETRGRRVDQIDHLAVDHRFSTVNGVPCRQP